MPSTAHLADFSVGSVGESSIVGSGIPMAVGAALGARMSGPAGVCLCSFGHYSASKEEAYHEGLNRFAGGGAEPDSLQGTVHKSAR